MTAIEVEGEGRASDWAPGRSQLSWYRHEDTGKRFYVLRQRGAFPELCYDHGRLLAREIEDGVFPEILDTIDDQTTTERDAFHAVAPSLFAQITADLAHAASGAFNDGVHRLFEGYREGHPSTPRYRFEDVQAACYAIDVGNVASGFLRRIDRWGEPGGWPDEEADYLRRALNAFGGDPGLVSRTNFGLIFRLLARLIGLRPSQGCTGFSVPASYCADEKALHARSFDGAFFAWNRYPGLHLVDERGPDQRARFRYAATGTAGLIYPGGISGINEAGIACSLHQMSTTTYSYGRSGERFEIAPYVQQRILREAGNLGEAIRLCDPSNGQGANHFASWAILVSDARNGQAISIEINGRDGAPRVGVLGPEQTGLQTNHFRHEELAEQFDHFGDAHFTPSVGKWLETHGRIRHVADRLGPLEGLMDTAEALRLLRGHEDPWIGGARRAFGRTVCKSYGIMASIARGDSDAVRRADELWFTIGHEDGRPGPHAPMAGFAINWAGFDLAPLAGPGPADSVPTSYRDALAAYVRAFRTLERPQTPAGYVRGLPDEGHRHGLRAEALGHLDRAVELSESDPDRPVDFVFRYVRARLLHMQGRFRDAMRDWLDLLRLAERREPPIPLHPYDRARIFTFAAATRTHIDSAFSVHSELNGRDDRTLEALLAVAERWRMNARDAMPAEGREHPGFSELGSLIWLVGRDGVDVELPDIDWVTIE